MYVADVQHPNWRRTLWQCVFDLSFSHTVEVSLDSDSPDAATQGNRQEQPKPKHIDYGPLEMISKIAPVSVAAEPTAGFVPITRPAGMVGLR